MKAEQGGPIERFTLGRAGDEVLMGSWECGPVETPAIYRPATGQVFIWDGWAHPGQSLAPVTVRATGVTFGSPIAMPSSAGTGGCETVEILPTTSWLRSVHRST